MPEPSLIIYEVSGFEPRAVQALLRYYSIVIGPRGRTAPLNFLESFANWPTEIRIIHSYRYICIEYVEESVFTTCGERMLRSAFKN